MSIFKLVGNAIVSLFFLKELLHGALIARAFIPVSGKSVNDYLRSAEYVTRGKDGTSETGEKNTTRISGSDVQRISNFEAVSFKPVPLVSPVSHFSPALIWH